MTKTVAKEDVHSTGVVVSGVDRRESRPVELLVKAIEAGQPVFRVGGGWAALPGSLAGRSSDQKESAERTSPPLREARALKMAKPTCSLMKRTLPSPKRKLAPPG